ncbi:MAG: NAD(FAD)-dependent dehydrogenase [Brevundimonas sp.]|uniref:NADPH-dependent FMN reductase n=1 Tax=Brevundimonas sp. TaxID=1871086 RepID=UPI000DB08B43|nr:NAD(P)H-dependent oxidoreductase [Brevundimonas sp.]PZT96888.1 MAG: NAD(FAD)-dependent dehydrogenase [Brevundimonas sp.]
MIHAKTILVVAGSVRPRRRCITIAEWIADLGRPIVDAAVEVVDLKDWPLPLDAEPGVPAKGGYVCDGTRAWSAKIASADAFVFVTPQYNWGYPASLKNALDHLYREWAGKPALVVTYGGHGGDKCARQLREVVTGLNMTPVAAMPALTLPRAMIEADAPLDDAAALFDGSADVVRQGWTELAQAMAAADVRDRA